MTTPTVDFHQHLWPATFIALLRRRTAPPRLEGTTLVTIEGAFAFDQGDHHLPTRIALLDRDGIDLAIASLQSTLGVGELPAGEREELEETWMEGTRGLIADADGRMAALAPWCVREGFVGTSVGASALLRSNGPAALDELARTGGAVFVHPEAHVSPRGRPAWWAWTAGYTAQMQSAYLAWLDGGRERYPGLRIVFAILAGGGPFHHERLAHRGVDVRSALDADVFFDTATYGRRAIELCLETFGVECLVYGSDVPVVEPSATLSAVRGFGDSVARLLLTDNPARILP